MNGMAESLRKPHPAVVWMARWIFPEHVILAGMGLLLASIWIFFVPDRWHGLRGFSVRTSFIAMGVLVVLAFLSRGRALFRGPEARRDATRAAFRVIREWLPFVLCVLVYENLHDATNVVRPDLMDEPLAAADQAIFGVQPTIWLEQHVTTPLFTDYLLFCYSGFFFFPPGVLLGLLYLRGQEFAFRTVAFTILACFCLGFVGYITVPAIGPRFVLREAYQNPVLGGILLGNNATEIFVPYEQVMRDCFPSLHTAISTASLFSYWRFRHLVPRGPVLFWVLVPFIVSLWFSTVYLRQHWVVDVFAGWALAAFVLWLAPRAVRAWLDLRDRRVAGTDWVNEWVPKA